MAGTSKMKASTKKNTATRKTAKTSAKAARKAAVKRVAAKAAKPRTTAARSQSRKASRPKLLSGGNPQMAKADGDATVQAYIAAMPGWKRDVGRRLDALITRNVPGVRKAVRWNSPFDGIEGTEDLPAAAEFWGAALGFEVSALPDEEGKYIQLVEPSGRLHIEVQSVTHPSRVHLDIETDDIEAEARRLEALGATRVQKVMTWWVMEAPTGQRFCVVRPQGDAFASTANTWE